MINYIVFGFGLIFLVFPYLSNDKSIGFVDYYLLFCLYFDITDVLIDSEKTSFIFSQYVIIFGFGAGYILNNYSSIKKAQGWLFNYFLLFLFISFSFPIFHGTELKASIVETTRIFASFSILPIAFHHYSTRGNIRNLFINALRFTYIFVLAIIVFTIYKIDSNYELASGEIWMSSKAMGGFLYFGNLGGRGGFTYIGYLVLLFPLFFLLKLQLRHFLLIVLGFVIIIIVLSFKRFAFVIVLLGLIVYLFSTLSSFSTKIKIALSSALVLFILVLITNLGGLAIERYIARGGAKGVGLESVESDMRLFEIGYAFNEIKNSPQDLLIGNKSESTLSVSSLRHSIDKWRVHNQYAHYLLTLGFLGLSVYLLYLINIYRVSKRRFSIINKSQFGSNINKYYWLLFSSYIFIFIIAGFIGGLDKITIRGMVFIFIGGIAGHFYKAHISLRTLNAKKNN